MRMSCSLTEQDFLSNKLPISLSYFLTILSAPVGSIEMTISLSATLLWMGAEKRYCPGPDVGCSLATHNNNVENIFGLSSFDKLLLWLLPLSNG